MLQHLLKARKSPLTWIEFLVFMKMYTKADEGKHTTIEKENVWTVEIF